MPSLFKMLFSLLKPKNLLMAGLSFLLLKKLLPGQGEQAPKEKGAMRKMLDSVKQFAGKAFTGIKDFAGRIFKKDEPAQPVLSEPAADRPPGVREGIRDTDGPKVNVEQPVFKVPQEIRGVRLNETDRAQLKDGKAVFVSGMMGNDGQKMSCWAKMNEKMGRMEYFSDHPDNPKRNISRLAVQENKIRQGTDSPKQEKSRNQSGRLKMQV